MGRGRIKGFKLSKEIKEKISIGTKKGMKKNNASLKISKALKGHKSWTEGLTKETDVRVKKISDSLLGHKHSKKTIKKIRDKMKQNPTKYWLGKSHYEETKKKISMSFQGVTEEQWKGFMSNKGYNLLEFNNNLKTMIRERDNFRCKLCNKLSNKKLCVHHIDYNKKNNKKDNLISLCNSCHSKTNKNRKYWEEKLKNEIFI